MTRQRTGTIVVTVVRAITDAARTTEQVPDVRLEWSRQ